MSSNKRVTKRKKKQEATLVGDLFKILFAVSMLIVAILIAFFVFPITLLILKADVNNNMALTIAYYLLRYLFEVNMVLAVFNILPIYPLDGFNALASQLKYDNPFVKFMHSYGQYILIGLVIVFSMTNILETIVGFVEYPIIAFWNLFF